MIENSELWVFSPPPSTTSPLPFQPLVSRVDGDSLCIAAAVASQAKRKQVTRGSCFLCPVPQKEVFSSQHRGSWWREVQEKHCCIQVMTKHLQIQPGSAELGSCREPRAASHHTKTLRPHQQGGPLGPETPQTNTAAVGEAVGGSPQGRRAQEAPRSEKMLEKGPAKNTTAE